MAIFYLRLKDGDKTTALEVPTGTLFSGAVIVALISAAATLATNFFVDIPRNRDNTELQKQTQLQTMQRFQLDLLQKALESKSAEYRLQSILLLVDMKLLTITDNKIKDFQKNADLIPQWLPEAAERSVETLTK